MTETTEESVVREHHIGNTDFKNGYKTRADASSRMSADQISDVALYLLWRGAGIGTILGEAECRKCETAKDFQ